MQRLDWLDAQIGATSGTVGFTEPRALLGADWGRRRSERTRYSEARQPEP